MELNLRHPETRQYIQWDSLTLSELIDLRRLATKLKVIADLKIRTIDTPDVTDRPLFDHRSFMQAIVETASLYIQEYQDTEISDYHVLSQVVNALPDPVSQRIWESYGLLKGNIHAAPKQKMKTPYYVLQLEDRYIAVSLGLDAEGRYIWVDSKGCRVTDLNGQSVADLMAQTTQLNLWGS